MKPRPEASSLVHRERGRSTPLGTCPVYRPWGHEDGGPLGPAARAASSRGSCSNRVCRVGRRPTGRPWARGTEVTPAASGPALVRLHVHLQRVWAAGSPVPQVQPVQVRAGLRKPVCACVWEGLPRAAEDAGAMSCPSPWRTVGLGPWTQGWCVLGVHSPGLGLAQPPCSGQSGEAVGILSGTASEINWRF